MHIYLLKEEQQADERNKCVIFNNCAPFINCKSGINNIEMDNLKTSI